MIMSNHNKNNMRRASYGFNVNRTSESTASVSLGSVEVVIKSGSFSFGGMTPYEKRWIIGDKTFQNLNTAIIFAKDSLIYEV